MKKGQFAVSVFLTIILFACANPGIIKLSPDTYMLMKQDHAGIFGSMAKLKAEVISEANAFAEGQGKVAIPVFAKETPVAPGRFATYEYQFRVVDKNDPEARRTSLTPRPDIVIDKTEKVTMDINTKDHTDKPKDVYTELIKLDDLRKRGIISEEEFEAQKKKLLRNN